jgi:uncharacterized protein YidB (DUF937 family)
LKDGAVKDGAVKEGGVVKEQDGAVRSQGVNDISKLSTLLDDPEVRVLIFGLAHVKSAPAEPGASRLRAVVLDLAATTTAEQYGSWLSDHAPNRTMTTEQVRLTIGDGALDDLAQYTGGDAAAVAWQLAVVLPDLVDAVSPGGEVIEASLIASELSDATAADDRSAGAFGSRVY